MSAMVNFYKKKEPTMEIARRLAIKSTIEYYSFPEAGNWLENNSFQTFCCTINFYKCLF